MVHEFVGWDTNNKKKKVTKEPRSYLPRVISNKESDEIHKKIGYQSRPKTDSQEPEHIITNKKIEAKLPDIDSNTPTITPKITKPRIVKDVLDTAVQ